MDKRTELQNKIIEKAMSDVSFKKALMENPKKALKEAFDINIPQNINIKVLEETDDQAYLVLPTSKEDKTAVNVIWT